MLSRNFSQKSVRENFRNFHTVCCSLTIASQFSSISRKFREIPWNQLSPLNSTSMRWQSQIMEKPKIPWNQCMFRSSCLKVDFTFFFVQTVIAAAFSRFKSENFRFPFSRKNITITFSTILYGFHGHVSQGTFFIKGSHFWHQGSRQIFVH